MAPTHFGYDRLDYFTQQYYDRLIAACAEFKRRENKNETSRNVKEVGIVDDERCNNIGIAIASDYYASKYY